MYSNRKRDGKKRRKERRRGLYKRIEKKFAYESKALASGDLLLLRHFVPSELNPSEESADYNLFRKVVLWGSLGLLLCICLCLCSIRILWRESIDWGLIFVFSALVWISSVSRTVCKSAREVDNLIYVERIQGIFVVCGLLA